MKLKIVFLTLIFATSLLSCKKQKTDLEFEQEVFYNVFNEILDSVYIDRKLFVPPPNDKDALKIYNRELSEYKKDTTKRVVAVYDYLDGFRSTKEFKNETINFNLKDSLVFLESHKIDLSKIKNQKLIFKYSSEFPKDYHIWYGKYNFNLAGEIYFSRIILDVSKTKGFLKCSYSCGEKAGRYYQISIRNKNGKWIIDKINLIGLS